MRKTMLAALLAVSLTIVSCGSAAPQPDAPAPTIPATASAPETAATPPQEVIRLFYFGSMTTSGDPAGVTGPHSIYSATSTDGLSFREDDGARFSYDAGGRGGITDPDIVRLKDGTWLMFLSLGGSVLKATSLTTTGVFIQDPGFRWNGGGVPGSFNFNGRIRTFVCSVGGISAADYDPAANTLVPSGIAIAAPSSGLICDPSVIEVDGKYLMFYKYQVGNRPPSEHEVYLATSVDGVTWTQHAQNRFICQGSVPGAVYYLGVIYVYYCGAVPKTGERGGDMGVAVSRDKGATFTLGVMRIEGRKALGAVDPAGMVVSAGE